MKRRRKLNIQLESWNPARLFLFVNLITAILIVLAAGSASLRYPIGSCSPAILIGTFLVTLTLAIPFRKITIDRRACLGVATGLGAVLCFLWPAISLGSMTSIFPDASNYVAFAQYLFKYPRGSDHGLSPVDQYATVFADSRFATSAVLGIVAEFLHGDAGLALIPFCAILLFNVFGGVTTLARHMGCARGTAVLAGVFSVVGGWVPDMYFVGSLDNLFFVSLLPFILVRLRMLMIGTASTKSALAFGACSAAAFYTYPEGLVIAGGIFLPVFVSTLIRVVRSTSALRKILIATPFAVALSLPYFQTFFSFLANQLACASEATVGNGIFPGLTSPAFFPALFGFGKEYPGTPYRWHDLLLPALLGILILFGILRWRRCNKALIWAFSIFVCLVSWEGVHNHYNYGVYKVLTVGTVLFIPAVFLGVDVISGQLSWRLRGRIAFVSSCILLLAAYVQLNEDFELTPKRFHFPLKPYSDLREIGSVTQGAPVSLMCDNDIDQEWALIYLRDQPLDMRFQRGSQLLPNVRFRMEQAKKPKSPARFFLVNRKMRGSIWANSKFWLVPVSEEFAPIIVSDTPNGVEEFEGSAFIWLSDRPSSFAIDSPEDGLALLFSKDVRIGPSRPEDSSRTVVIRDAGGLSQCKVADAFYTLVCLKKGLNHLEMWCAERPTREVLPNGDTRTLMLGLKDYQVRIISGNRDFVEVIHSANGLEPYQGMPLLWLSNEMTTLLIFSQAKKECLLQADQVILKPSNPAFPTRVVVVKSQDSERRWVVSDQFSIPISVKPGLNRVDLRCDNIPGVRPLPNADSRGLLLGLVNYRVTQVPQ
jgi:hypothetical protein